jgi:hypothetical protein
MLSVLLRKPHYALHRTRPIEMLYPHPSSSRFQAEPKGIVGGQRSYGCCCDMGPGWHFRSFHWLFTRHGHTKAW